MLFGITYLFTTSCLLLVGCWFEIGLIACCLTYGLVGLVFAGFVYLDYLDLVWFGCVFIVGAGFCFRGVYV